jgi:hypothetical protein
MSNDSAFDLDILGPMENCLARTSIFHMWAATPIAAFDQRLGMRAAVVLFRVISSDS